jgi:hypothetical protein
MSRRPIKFDIHYQQLSVDEEALLLEQIKELVRAIIEAELPDQADNSSGQLECSNDQVDRVTTPITSARCRYGNKL